MRIKTKLRWVAICLVAVTVSVGLLLFFMAGQIDKSLERGEEARQVVKGVFELNLITYDYLLHPGERTLKQWRLKYDSLSKVISNSGFGNDKEKLSLNHEEIKGLFNQIIANNEREGLRGAQNALHREARGRITSQLMAKTQMMLSDASLLRNKSDIEIALLKQRASSYLIVSIILMIAIVTSTSLHLSRSIGGSLHRLEEGAKIIAGGNLSYKVNVEGKDETGQLAHAFNEMTSRLKTSYASIDDLKRAEEALRQSELKYRIVAENPYDWEFWVNPEGNFIYVSPSCNRATGREAEEFMRDADLRRKIVFPEDLPIFDRHRQEEEEEVIPQEIEFRILHKDGSIRWIGHVCKRIFDEEGRFLGIRASSRDITARIGAEQSLRESEEKARESLEMQVHERTRELQAEIEERKRVEEALRESEKELRDLSSQLLVVQEKERREIAGDLHDNIWQTLGNIKFDIENFFSRQADGSLVASHQEAHRVISSIRKAIEKIRMMQGDLWPPTLDDIGIVATINWYCREFEKDHAGISIENQIGLTEEEVPQHAKIIIFRVMQEALKNVARHSGATSVRISLKKENERVEFTVNDNGRGFDIERILFRTRPWVGFGLAGMRQKIEHSGGTFDVRSGDGPGTTVRASWSLTDSDRVITDRKPISRVLEESKDQFRLVTEAISDWVYAFRVELDGKVFWDWITPGFTAATGYRIDEFHDGTDLTAILHPDDRYLAQEQLWHIRGLRPHVSEYRIITRNGDICWVRDSINPVADPLHPGRVRVIGASQNITEAKKLEEDRRRAEWERETTIEFLRLVNESRETEDLIEAAATFFQGQSRCEAVGIRLRKGDDYPYFEARGFPKEFVLAENQLCERDSAGRPICDTAGYPIMECMCGNVICSRFDPSKPFFTAHGSFWTNCTTELLASTTEADRQARTRNRCNGEGYESVALIALRVGEERLGLLQLNDRRKGRFSPESIALWERLAGYLAVAYSKFRTEESLRETDERLKMILNSMTERFIAFDNEWRYTYLNEQAKEQLLALGKDPEKMIGKVLWDEFPNPPVEDVFRRAMRDRISATDEHWYPPLEEWVENRIYPMPDGGLAVFQQYVTERKQAENFSQAINHIGELIHSTLDFDEIMRRVISESARAIGSETAAISLRQEEGWIVRYVYGFPNEVIGTRMNDDQEPHAVLAIRTKKPVVVNDAFNDDRVNREHMKKWGVRSVLVVPLTTEEQVIGVLFFNHQKRFFDFHEAHVDFANKLASSISLAIRNARLFEKVHAELAERR